MTVDMVGTACTCWLMRGGRKVLVMDIFFPRRFKQLDTLLKNKICLFQVLDVGFKFLNHGLSCIKFYLFEFKFKAELVSRRKRFAGLLFTLLSIVSCCWVSCGSIRRTRSSTIWRGSKACMGCLWIWGRKG